MALPAPRRIAVTGAPGAGKSSLIAELAARGWRIMPEAARAILQQPGGMGLRAQDPLGFARAMLEAELAAFDSISPGETVIFDRGFCDIVAFLRIEGLPVSGEVEEACRGCRFDAPVIHAPAWRDIYRQDNERIQSWEQALESGRQNLEAWHDFGYEPVTLPLGRLETRVAFIEDLLA